MRFLSALWALASGSPVPEALDDSAAGQLKHVAIIGAGAAGSSAAYHLRKFAEQEGLQLNITIFEKSDRVGGRAVTVNIFDNPFEPAELGASIFVKSNHILWNASQELNLTLQNPDYDDEGILAVWDGDNFVFRQDYTSWDWWNLTKLFWKYGLAPYRTQKLVESAAAKFLGLYHAPFFPFRSITAAAYDLGLNYMVGETGEQYLSQNSVGQLYAHDIVQASTRVNYASNLGYIHGLDTMVSMAPQGARQVAGGNWQIFHRMVAHSGAKIQLNTSISSIALQAGVRGSKRYTLKTASTDAALSAREEQSDEFDHVVIATPYQFSGIEVANNVLEHTIDKIPYVKLHVTLFTSPFLMSPAFFNQPAGSRVPNIVMTTLSKTDKAVSGDAGAGKAGFWSISTHRKAVNPKTGMPEHVYKVFSPKKLTPGWLSELLGVDIPATFTGQPVGEDPESVEPISWYHAQVFNSYPKAYPRVTFQDPFLRDGLHYTSGMESFISTMETNALMGMNVARLIVDDFLGSETPSGMKEKPVVEPASEQNGPGTKDDEL